MVIKKYWWVGARLSFVLFSLKYLYDAFFQWDGYSYYLRFREILPDFSLAFILWSICSIIFVSILWLITFLSFLILSKLKEGILYEHILTWFIIVAGLYSIKRIYIVSTKDIEELIGIDRFFIWIGGGILIVFICWLGRKFIERYTQRVLLKLNNIISPLVWIFGFFLILSIPLSIPLFFREYGRANITHNEQTLSLKTHPNIILVTMDALSAKDMQVYGYHRPTTPFITQWARNAILFKRAYASSNWTPPTTMSLMTGQRPWTHKNLFLSYLYPFRRYEQNLPALLREAGYMTYAFVQNFNANPNALGIAHAFVVNDPYYTFFSRPPGFEGKFYNFLNYMEDTLRSRIAIKWIKKHPLFIPIWTFYPTDTEKTSTPPHLVFDRFLKYISANPKQPFFAWLHIEAPHFPFLPPDPYMGMFGDGDKFNTEFKQTEARLFHYSYGLERQKEVDILKKRQDEFILYVDQEFKLFLSRLKEIVDMDKTVIILSADHGTSVGRGFVGHGKYRLYEEITNIPLIIKLPEKMLSIKNGKVIDIPVEQIDIAPTILDLAGIPIPEWMEGRSLVPLLKGKSFEPRPVFSMELGHNRVIGDHPFTKYSIAVWDGDYKLIYYAGWEGKTTELFNLKSDPGETTNIIHNKPHIAKYLLALIEEKLSYATKKRYVLSK